MNKIILSHDEVCEVCGETISAGESAIERFDYDWNSESVDEQGSIAIEFYRHGNPETCKTYIEVMQISLKIDAQTDEDSFRKALY